MELTISDDIPPPNDGASTVTDNGSSSRFSCEVCSLPLTYAGKGRYPRFCAEHKPGPQRAANTTGGRTKSIDILISQMTDLYAGVATGLTFLPSEKVQVDGMILASGASKLAESWRPLIENDPKIRKFWTRMTTGSGYGAVIIAHVMIALPILSNHGLVPNGVKSPEPTGVPNE